jgi:hypothetical protein
LKQENSPFKLGPGNQILAVMDLAWFVTASLFLGQRIAIEWQLDDE